MDRYYKGDHALSRRTSKLLNQRLWLWQEPDRQAEGSNEADDAGFVYVLKSNVYPRYWISQGSLILMDQKRQLLNCKKVNKMRRQPQSQLKISLEKDRENGGLRWPKKWNRQPLQVTIKDCCGLNATLMGGELRLVKSFAIKTENQLIVYIKDSTIGLNTLMISLAARTLM